MTDAVSAAARFTPDLMIVEERLDDGSGIVAVDEIIRQQPIPHLFAPAMSGGSAHDPIRTLEIAALSDAPQGRSGRSAALSRPVGDPINFGGRGGATQL